MILYAQNFYRRRRAREIKINIFYFRAKESEKRFEPLIKKLFLFFCMKYFKICSLIFVGIIFSLVIFFYISERADAIMIPYFNIKIITNSSGGDANFFYKLQEFTFGNKKSFNIQTQNGSGNYSDWASIYNYNTGSDVEITQSTSSDWKLSDATCTSTDKKATFKLEEQTLQLYVYPDDSVTCTFTNTKVIKKNPVIIIPGIASSYLNENSYDNKEVWLNLLKMSFSGGDDYLDELALDEIGQPDLTRTVLLPTDIFRKISSKDFFDGLINELKSNGYVENENLFVFPYDWRLDIRDNVDNLYSPLLTTLKDKIDKVLTQTGTQKVDIVAHSMGGLLGKYYIEHYGQGKVDKFIDIATPHLGSPSSIKTLIYGDDVGIKIGGVSLLNFQEIKKVSQNFPSIYQLLPSKNYFSDSLSDYNYYVFDMNDYDSDGVTGKLSFDQTKDFMKNTGRNPLILNSATNIHDDIDNVNPADYGVKTYNIVGCGTPTLGKIFALGKQTDKDPQYDVTYISGDGTVPERSAEAMSSLKQYYVSKAEHGIMPSINGVKQLVDSILSDKEDVFDYSSNTNISSTSSRCKLPNGTFLGFHSPVELNIYDEAGNHTGPNTDGDLEQNIPDIAYDIIDGNKFAYLPDGQNYRIELKATEPGSFSSHIKKINNEKIISTDYFNDVPLTSTSTKAQVDIYSSTPSITLDKFGDGSSNQNISPSAVLTSNNSISDLTPPQSTSTVSVDGVVSLFSTDDFAGVLKTEYSFDGINWNLYSEPFIASGKIVYFFSTDNAGNIEQIKIITVPIIEKKTSGGRRHMIIESDISTSTADSTSTLENQSVTIENQQEATDTEQNKILSLTVGTDNSLLSTSSIASSSSTVFAFSTTTIKVQSQVVEKIVLSKNKNKNLQKIALKVPSLQVATSTSISKIDFTASVGNSKTNITSIIINTFHQFWSNLFLLLKKI